MQTPCIPIWVGGGWPNKGPTQRAARWDGSLLYKQTTDGTGHNMMPEDVRALKATVEQQGARAKPYDSAFGGNQRFADWDALRAHLEAVAEAGATW